MLMSSTLLPILVGLFEEGERHVQRAADIVDEDVEPAFAFNQARDGAVDLIALHHVDGVGLEGQAIVGGLAFGLLQRLGVAVPDRDAGAFARKPPRAGLAQSRRCGRDQRHTPVISFHMCSLISLLIAYPAGRLWRAIELDKAPCSNQCCDAWHRPQHSGLRREREHHDG